MSDEEEQSPNPAEPPDEEDDAWELWMKESWAAMPKGPTLEEHSTPEVLAALASLQDPRPLEDYSEEEIAELSPEELSDLITAAGIPLEPETEEETEAEDEQKS